MQVIAAQSLGLEFGDNPPPAEDLIKNYRDPDYLLGMYLRHTGSSPAEHGKRLKIQLEVIEKMEREQSDRKRPEPEAEKKPNKKPNINSTPPRGTGSNDRSHNPMATELFK